MVNLAENTGIAVVSAERKFDLLILFVANLVFSA